MVFKRTGQVVVLVFKVSVLRVFVDVRHFGCCLNGLKAGQRTLWGLEVSLCLCVLWCGCGGLLDAGQALLFGNSFFLLQCRHAGQRRFVVCNSVLELVGLLQLRQLLTRFALGLNTCKVICAGLSFGFSRQIVKLLLESSVLLFYFIQVLRRLLVGFKLVSFFFSFLGFLFAQFAGFFLLLHDDFTTRACTLRQTTCRTQGGKKTNLVGSLAVFFQGVSVRQGQACLRTLHHLLCNLGWNLGDSTGGGTFCKRSQ